MSIEPDSEAQPRGESRSLLGILVLAALALLGCAACILGAVIAARAFPTVPGFLPPTSTTAAPPANRTESTATAPARTATAEPVQPFGPVQGGLTDAELKSQVWDTILSFYANVRDCEDVRNANIAVLQDVDDEGVWEETWTVVSCGESAELIITFTPDGSGGHYYDIRE